MKRILVVEDERSISEGLKFNFEQEGYAVTLAEDGPTAIDLVRANDPPIDLIILDLMLPSMSGYDACTQIREFNPHVPILVLSARTLSEDKAQAFDCGTDQYMTKPFALPELLSRVRNLTERRRMAPLPVEKRQLENFEFGNNRIDFTKFQVVNGETVHTLTTMELQLLKYFVEHPGVVLSRNQILRDVWDETADVTSRSIDNFVLRLRKMVEPDPASPIYLISVRGTGYRFSPHGDASQ